MSEAREQQAVIEWCAWRRISTFHIPNGGSRDKREAANVSVPSRGSALINDETSRDDAQAEGFRPLSGFSVNQRFCNYETWNVALWLNKFPSPLGVQR